MSFEELDLRAQRMHVEFQRAFFGVFRRVRELRNDGGPFTQERPRRPKGGPDGGRYFETPSTRVSQSAFADQASMRAIQKRLP